MPTVSTTTTVTANTFWISANILFDLETGATKQVLLLVNKVEDATIFNANDAQNYINFVKQRAKNIIWSIERLTEPLPSVFPRPLFELPSPERFVIKGVQYVG